MTRLLTLRDHVLFVFVRRLEKFGRLSPDYSDNAFIQTQKDLVTLWIGGWPEEEDEIPNSSLFRIFDYCPKLRVLQCDYFARKLELADLPRLVSLIAKLQSFALHFEVNMSPDTPMCEVIKHLPERFDLTTLDYGNSKTNEDLCVALLERCPSLRSLTLGFVSDKILQTIFEHLVSELRHWKVVWNFSELILRERNDEYILAGKTEKFVVPL